MDIRLRERDVSGCLISLKGHDAYCKDYDANDDYDNSCIEIRV